MKRLIVESKFIYNSYTPLYVLQLSGTDLISAVPSGSSVSFCQHIAAVNLPALAN